MNVSLIHYVPRPAWTAVAAVPYLRPFSGRMARWRLVEYSARAGKAPAGGDQFARIVLAHVALRAGRRR